MKTDVIEEWRHWRRWLRRCQLNFDGHYQTYENLMLSNSQIIVPIHVNLNKLRTHFCARIRPWIVKFCSYHIAIYILAMLHEIIILYTVCLKKRPRFYFLNILIKISSIFIIFGVHHYDQICHQPDIKMTTSPRSCRCTTLWNLKNFFSYLRVSNSRKKCTVLNVFIRATNKIIISSIKAAVRSVRLEHEHSLFRHWSIAWSTVLYWKLHQVSTKRRRSSDKSRIGVR